MHEWSYAFRARGQRGRKGEVKAREQRQLGTRRQSRGRGYSSKFCAALVTMGNPQDFLFLQEGQAIDFPLHSHCPPPLEEGVQVYNPRTIFENRYSILSILVLLTDTP